MALSLSGCRHTPERPFAGMRRAGLTEDGEGVVFRCDSCGARHVEARCAADSRFARCRNAARSGLRTCAQHRLRTSDVEVAS